MTRSEPRWLYINPFALADVRKERRLTPMTAALLDRLVMLVNVREPHFWAGTLWDIGEFTGMGVETIARGLDRLAAAGLLVIHRPFRPGGYGKRGVIELTAFDLLAAPPDEKRVKGPLSDRGVVYYAERPDGAIKIGFTIGDPEKRLKALRTAIEVRLLAWHRGGQKAERALHRRFADLRLDGEWFSPKPELVDHVEHVAKVGQERHPDGFVS